MAGDTPDAAPVDFDVLEDMGRYLTGSDRFETVEWRPASAPDSLVCTLDGGWYPASVEEASLQITWYQNDDFHVHYQELWTDGQERKCRWDRHPNGHNARAHYHPLPDAATPGLDESFPRDWKDVLSMVLGAVDERLESFWTG